MTVRRWMQQKGVSMYARTLVLIAGCLSLAGCLRTVIESPVACDGVRDDASGVNWFALSPVTHNAQECKYGIAKAETYMPVWGAFVYGSLPTLPRL